MRYAFAWDAMLSADFISGFAFTLFFPSRKAATTGRRKVEKNQATITTARAYSIFRGE